MNEQLISIPHIGEVPFEEFLEPLKISQNVLSFAIGVPSNRINVLSDVNEELLPILIYDLLNILDFQKVIF